MELGEEGLSRFFSLTGPFLDERQRRLLAASMVEVLGRGGQARVAGATGMSRNTLLAGASELAESPVLQARVRRPGAGPKRKADLDPDLLVMLDSLVDPESRGDPMSPLRWTAKSTRTLAAELTRLGHKVGANLVGDLLHYLGYSLQANAKVTEGAQHPDRDGQFRYINDTAAEHLAANQPVISVDCKKKELVGDYKNGGAEWEPAGSPTRVGVHDFPDLRDRFLVALLAETGMRVGQALGLRHGDFVSRERTVRVVPRADNANGARAKCRQVAEIPVSAPLVRLYSEYLFAEYGDLDSDYVFVNLFAQPLGRPLTYSAVAGLVARLSARTGIAFSPHVLRHTAASGMIRAGVPIEVVSKILTHSNVSVTSGTYVHLGVEDLRAELVRAGLA